MSNYPNVPKLYINQLAKANKVVFSGKDREVVIDGLIEKNQEKLNYLNEQFKFTSPYMTICKPESNFPDKSKTPELFISTLIKENLITKENINTQWQPELDSNIKICAIKQDGSAVYLKFVERKSFMRRSGYGTIPDFYASFRSVVIHFGQDEIIQLRCPSTEVKKYSEHVMKIMGFATPFKWFPVPKLTKDNAVELCTILSAGVASRHIAMPSTVGSLKFNGKKGVNLSNDKTFHTINKAIQDIGLPTDQTMDETCFFSYVDNVTGITIEATFEVNIQSGYFKFTKQVPEVVFDHVLEALVKVNNGSINIKETAVAKN